MYLEYQVHQAVMGTINNNLTNNLSVSPTTDLTSVVSIIWGDSHEFTNPDIDKDNIYVEVAYEENGNSANSYSNNFDVTINAICAPIITKSADPKACCITPITYTALGSCKADNYTWTVIGATMQSGQGTTSISVLPPATGSYSITCQARRNASVTNYYRETTANITIAPITIPSITSSVNEFCVGNSYALSIGNLCNVSSITWTAAGCTFSNPNSSNPTIFIPTNLTGTGTTIEVKASVSYNGGCSTVSTKTFKVWANQINEPAGTFTWEYSSNYTTDVKLKFIPSNEVNGKISCADCGWISTLEYYPPCPYTSTSTKYITVNVCYENACLTRCKTFQVPVYKPLCPKNPYTPKYRLGDTTNNDISVYPNPAQGQVNVVLPDANSGSYRLLTLEGREILSQYFEEGSSELSIPLNNIATGLYVLELKTEHFISRQKLIVNQ